MPSTSEDVKIIASSVQKYLLCTKGEIIKRHFLKNNQLIGKQCDLCNLIIEKEFDTTNNFKIKSERLEELASEICEIFASERKNVYFVPYCNKPRSLATGKLWAAYNKLKSKVKIALKETNSPPTNNIEASKELQLKINTLKSCKDESELQWQEIVEIWSATSSFRLSQLVNSESKNHLSEYFSEYPVLTFLNGFKLFEKDFENLFPLSVNLFTENWFKVNAALVNIAKSIKPTNHHYKLIQNLLNEPNSDLQGLFVLPYLINNNFGRKRNSENEPFKLTKKEIADTFIVRVSVSKN